MKRWIGMLLACLFLISPMTVSAATWEDITIDVEQFVLYADFLITGDEEPYEIGPLVKRFDAEMITDPNLTFEQLEEHCDQAAGALYRSGEYAGIVLFELKDDRWVCYQIIKPDPAFLEQIEQLGTDFLWPYNLGGNVSIQTEDPHTVFYFSKLYSDYYPKELRFAEYMQCVSCEIDKFGYMENRMLRGVYDTADMTYAYDYWNKNWFEEHAALIQLLCIIGGIALITFGVDRLLMLREKKRGKRK